MKKISRITAILLCLFLILSCFAGCDGWEPATSTTTQQEVDQNGNPYKLSFIADFYDNNGEKWLTSQGSSFDISPNKVKEYSYDSDGSWISKWEMSSVVSVNIDGNAIDSCGSTVIIYDNYLVKQDCVLPSNYTDSSTKDSPTKITSPNDIRLYDYWTINWWWKTKDTRNYKIGEKIVMIQSQNGDPICLFSGKEVKWEVSKNLPKTTEITIDKAKLYIHRANFAIIDRSIFTKGDK